MAVISSTHYDFDERLAWSNGFADVGIDKILRNRIPGCVAVERAESQDDKNGTDYWAIRDGLPALSVDVKARSKDYAPDGKDDLALETWSVIGKRPGWTRDRAKRTDFVLWFWADTGRFFLVSFPVLCDVFSQYWSEWRKTYRPYVQSSGAWQSECIFVPRNVVLDKLTAWTGGSINLSA